MRLFDSHAHLNSSKFQHDQEAVIQRARENGLIGIVNIGYDGESSRLSVALAEKYPDIWAVIGVHPHDAHEANEEDFRIIESLLAHPKVRGVGEIGLDYYRDLSPRSVQQDVFRRQIVTARKWKKPVVIHDRDAHGDILRIMQEENAGINGGIMHCFSGSKETAKLCMDMGFYISIAGPVTFRNAPKLQEVARYIPMDRLLVETDCPYLAPEPYRGKRNEPAYVRLVAEKIAALKGMDPEDFGNITTANTLSVLGITPS
jgi:TatD DNase family protein